MTEAEARAWMAARYGSSVITQVDRFADMVIAANQTQNLIAPGTIETIWARHIVDSAQLIAHARADDQTWLDVGTGGGFPGMIVALCWPGRVVMVEPRRRRAEFLGEAVNALALGDRASVRAVKIEAVGEQADVISARAVASIEKLLQAAGRCATPKTRWILPRGRSSNEQDLAHLFHVEQSATDPESRIVLIDGVGR
ncbi:MAG TPA: 16S rRNA (guanine(527)-N(7))-methyltransferase RsmG [Sphingomonas sp.]|nr:16S rRNA (guanine(527)-N(7))-methyltransferase RsmG [Sphingomonas sp.]